MRTHLDKILVFFLAELFWQMHKPRRVLFDHLPKCAGTTVTDYLRMHYSWRVTFRTDGWNPQKSVERFKNMPQSSRYRYHLIVGHFTSELLDYVHPATVIFTVFRDPIDRVISHYFYVKKAKQHYLHDRIVRSNIPLEDYASCGLSSELRNWYTTHFSGLSIDEAESGSNDSVHQAVQVISKRYDFIGFQDDLSETLHRLRKIARLHKSFDKRHLNRTHGRLRLEEVPENVRRAIAEANSLDLRLYALLKAKFGQQNRNLTP